MFMGPPNPPLSLGILEAEPVVGAWGISLSLGILDDGRIGIWDIYLLALLSLFLGIMKDLGGCLFKKASALLMHR